MGQCPGYLKALERGNSVMRPKRFCEANKEKITTVLLQNPKCRNLHIMHTLSIFGYLWITLWETPASLWEARLPFKRPGLPLRGPASLGQARPPCKRPGLPVSSLASMAMPLTRVCSWWHEPSPASLNRQAVDFGMRDWACVTCKLLHLSSCICSPALSRKCHFPTSLFV